MRPSYTDQLMRAFTRGIRPVIAPEAGALSRVHGTWLLGMDGKEGIVDRLADLGLMTRERARFSHLGRTYGDPS